MTHALHTFSPDLECSRCRAGDPATAAELTEALALALYGSLKSHPAKPSNKALGQWFEISNAMKRAQEVAA